MQQQFQKVMNNLQELNRITDAYSTSEKMPLLFLGHGSPMNAIEDNQFVQGFRWIAQSLPAPTAILCISAHWYTNGTFVTAMQHPKTIHDFYGFPEELYRVRYPAPGSPELALQTKQLLLPVETGLDQEWGLDHGAWSVIKHLYPAAKIPVIQLSIDYTKPASYHYELAKQLQSLRSKGVLIIGSGNLIHNLRLADFRNLDKDNYGFDWAIEAHKKMNHWLADGNDLALIDYLKQDTAIQLAVPTPDHYLPLMYVLGLKSKQENINLFNDKLLAGSLSMTSIHIA